MNSRSNASSQTPPSQASGRSRASTGVAPIGVFDSGSGGLTVLQALRQAMPEQPFVYLGDHANTPYGPRSGPEVYELTRRGVEFLFDQGCRLVILACNTAAAIALRKLQQEWLPNRAPEHRVLGVLVPMVEAITGRPWIAWEAHPPQELTGTVAVFATEGTVKSETFPVEVAKRAARLHVVQQACPDLVPAIEAHRSARDVQAIVSRYVGELVERSGQRPDWAVLGCTHYPLARQAFEAALGPAVTLLCQPSVTAESLHHYLLRHPGLITAGEKTKDTDPLHLFTSGDPASVAEPASLFFTAQGVVSANGFEAKHWQYAAL